MNIYFQFLPNTWMQSKVSFFTSKVKAGPTMAQLL